jgi:hypothetical protein
LNIPNYATGNSAGFTGNLVGDVNGPQGATIVSKINGVALSSLATGILKNTSGTGVPSIAVASDFPILNQNTTGSAATAIAAATQAIGDSSTKIASTEFVALSLVSKTNKAYVDNLLTSKAPLASPDLTGTPTAPTASAGANSTQIATTAYVDKADNLKANLASPTFTGMPLAPTATVGTNTTQVATTEFVNSTLESTEVTVGKAGASNGNGVRIGNARFTINKPTAPSTSSSNTTLSITQVLEAGIFVGTSSSSRTIKIPKASGSTGLVKALPNATVGDIVTVLIVNGGTSTLTIDVEDSTVTKVPSSMIVPAGTSRVIYIRVTDTTLDSEKTSIY